MDYTSFTNFTPEFTRYCTANYKNFNTSSSAVLSNFNQPTMDELLNNLDKRIPEELKWIQDFAQKQKTAIDEYVKTQTRIGQVQIGLSQEQQNNLDAYNAFFIKLNKKLALLLNQNEKHHAYPSYHMPQAVGQSFFDTMIGSIGYEQQLLINGVSGMVTMAISALKFLLGTTFWTQVGEYNDAPEEKKFNPHNITALQKAMQLNQHSTAAEILQAGFAPLPNLAKACELDVKNIAQNIQGSGSSFKENEATTLARRQSLLNRQSMSRK